MAKFWVDFRDYCLVEAPNKEQAENEFFEGQISSTVYEIEGIEQAEIEGEKENTRS